MPIIFPVGIVISKLTQREVKIFVFHSDCMSKNGRFRLVEFGPMREIESA